MVFAARGLALGWGVAAAVAGAVLLSSCGPSDPSARSLLTGAARAMAPLSYHLQGSDRAGDAKVSFSVQERANGDFSGQVDFAVPPSPVLSTRVVAVGDRVYVLAPGALSQLGITSLPGNLNPATTWVLQPSTDGSRYRQSVSPFVGAGLTGTLKLVLRGQPTVRAATLSGSPVWLLEERPRRGPSLSLYLQQGSDRLLMLTITGPDGIQLRYNDFNRVAPVAPPPSGQVYVPPTPAPGA